MDGVNVNMKKWCNGRWRHEDNCGQEEDKMEKQCLNQKNHIEIKKKEFVQSFTVHGLSRIFTGTRLESIFWSLVVLFGITISSFVIYGLVAKYYRYEIYTEVTAKVTNQNTFPAITFCDYNLMKKSYFAYCRRAGLNRPNLPCDKLPLDLPEINDTIDNNMQWSNGLFNVTKCVTWGSKPCHTDKYLKSINRLNHACFTWNWNGDLYDVYSHVEIEFELNKTAKTDFSYMVGMVHDHRIKELDMTSMTTFEPAKTYQLQVSKTLLKRLPNPFPSNCTNSMPHNIFPGKYSRRDCIDSLNFLGMLKECGDTMDYVKKYIPPELQRRYRRINVSEADAAKCMYNYSKTEVTSVEDCPVPCEEWEFAVTSSFHELQKDLNKDKYIVHLQYMNVDAYKIIEEKQLYSWDQIAGEIGGFIGLVIGASFISLIEIMAYCFLCFF